MDFIGLFLTVFMVLIVVWVYIICRWGADEYSCHDREYFIGLIPCYWIYFMFVFFLILLSLYVYYLIMIRDDPGYLFTIYYILVILALAFASWWFFEFVPSKMQIAGLSMIVIGLILYML